MAEGADLACLLRMGGKKGFNSFGKGYGKWGQLAMLQKFWAPVYRSDLNGQPALCALGEKQSAGGSRRFSLLDGEGIEVAWGDVLKRGSKGEHMLHTFSTVLLLIPFGHGKEAFRHTQGDKSWEVLQAVRGRLQNLLCYTWHVLSGRLKTYNFHLRSLMVSWFHVCCPMRGNSDLVFLVVLSFLLRCGPCGGVSMRHSFSDSEAKSVLRFHIFSIKIIYFSIFNFSI